MTPPLPPNAGFLCGKLPPKVDPRTLQLKNYLSPLKAGALPPAVHNVLGPNGQSLVPTWPDYYNHKYGTCVPCGMLHRVQVWSANSLPYQQPPDPCALTIYTALTGFNPATGQPDNGCSMVAANNYERSVGIGINHHKTTGWAILDAFSPDHVQYQRGIFQFGAVQIGLLIPEYVFTLWDQHQPWTNETGTTIDGVWGHSVSIFGYDADWLYFVNVDRSIRMSWDFLTKYVDEAYTYTTPLWQVKGEGFDAAGFAADVAKVTA